MHQSGISAGDKLKADFQAFAEDKDTLAFKIIIDKDDFVQSGAILKQTGSQAGNLAAIAETLEPKSPCYVMMRLTDLRFVTIFYMPDSSPVRSKMIYASSTGTLKHDLGGAKFEDDWSISGTEECTEEGWKIFKQDMTQLVKSFDERMNDETAHASAGGVGEKVSAIVGIPIKIADKAIEALKGLKAGTHSSVTLILDAETEVLGCEDPCNAGIDELEFPAKEPRYFVQNFKHSKDGEEASKVVFIYYCPGAAKPKLKMFYSTVKKNILQLFTSLEMTQITNFECDTKSECTEEALMEELYPKKAEDTSFKKPSARGRGKARPVAKFQSS